MLDKPPDLILAGLSLWVVGREFEQGREYWDANWLYVRARVEMPGAFVEAEGTWLRADELESFTGQLEVVVRDLRGSAELLCMEPNLGMKVQIGTRGDVTATVDLTPDLINQSHQFVFNIDQSHLIETLAGCQRILSRFPVRCVRPGASV